MKVSVIISNRNDSAMLAVTVRSALEELKAIPSGGEVVIVDNSDQPIWEMLKAGHFISKRYFETGAVRLFRQDYPCLFTAREEAIRRARGEFIVCLDSHMIVGHRMIRDLVDFMNANRDNHKIGFAHAPISWCHQHESQAKHDRNVAVNELGPWGGRYNLARRITWKGMPWICRKNTFWKIGGYGALSRHRLAWGGGDMHIGVKPWLLGFENWAVPCSPAIHIGPFPEPAKSEHKYRLYAKSGEQVTTLGFLVACYVLGGELMMKRNEAALREKFKLNTQANWEQAKALGAEERQWLLANQIMDFDTWLREQPWNAH